MPFGPSSPRIRAARRSSETRSPPHLHLHVGEARRYGFADECPDLDVVVAEPAGGRRVGGVARGDDRLLASCGFAPRVAEQIECFPGSQRVGDVAEVDACDKILRREIDEQLPQRLALDLGPEVPDRVDDRSGAEVDDTLLRTEPAQLAVRDEAPPEATHVGDDRLETPPDHERLERANRRDAHLRTATTRERQPVTFDSVVRIGAQNHIGRRIVRIGVHRIRPVERPRGREPHVTSLQADDPRKRAHRRIHPMFTSGMALMMRITAQY